MSQLDYILGVLAKSVFADVIAQNEKLKNWLIIFINHFVQSDQFGRVYGKAEYQIRMMNSSDPDNNYRLLVKFERKENCLWMGLSFRNESQGFNLPEV
jgi:hypothetical protein